MLRFTRPDETQRLAVLRDLAIVDTPPEAAYDDIATLAAAICRSPVAAVNFVESDRHWTKAIVGVEGGQGDSVSADLSFCAETIRSENGVMTVDDTLDDDRWREHPAVVGEPGVRFYAGATVFVADHPVAVVCVFGPEPREITRGEQAALTALARQTGAHLELRSRNAELRRLAVSDPLTGLPNRTLLLDRLELALAQRRRVGGEVGVLFCDVNGFKGVNDRYGHGVGDDLLADLAARLLAAARDTDTVARIAGDEFVVVCPGLGSLDDLRHLRRRVRAQCRGTDVLPDGAEAPSVAVGAVLALDGEGAADVLRRADAAMYRAKRLV